MKEILLLLAMFWNVENYFDPFDNPDKNDDQFTAKGEYFWGWKKFEKKRDDIARTIILAADTYGQFPALVGLCEVENGFVLRHLLEHTPLSRAGYSFIHRESPDSRGIDVALLYREDAFRPLEEKFYGAGFPTREVLYAKGVVHNLDTVHVLVNHWPSKRGGETASQPRRMEVSNMVKMVVDSIFAASPDADIILMGDLNDGCSSEAVENLFPLVNLAGWAEGAEGTHKYRGEWNIIDHFSVSEGLLASDTASRSGSFSPQWLRCNREMEIFAPQWLLVPDETHMGVKPNRTLQGPKYLGGVSDHLPIILKIYGPEY